MQQSLSIRRAINTTLFKDTRRQTSQSVTYSCICAVCPKDQLRPSAGPRGGIVSLDVSCAVSNNILSNPVTGFLFIPS